MTCVYSVYVYFYNNLLFDICFIFLEDIAQLCLLIQLNMARGYFSVYEIISLSLTIFVIVTTFLFRSLESGKFFQNPDTLEGELRDIRITNDQSTVNNDIRVNLLPRVVED